MLLNFIEIGCKSLTKSADVLISKFGFSLLNETHNICSLKNKHLEIVLRESVTEDVHRVTNIAFSHPSLEHIAQGNSNRFQCGSFKIKEDCPIRPGLPYIEVPSSLPHVAHRVYQEEQRSTVIPTPSSLPLDIDHILYCCPRNEARFHADWYSRFLDLKPYQFEGSDSGAMRVLVNGSGMDMYVKHGSSLPIFAFSEPIVENKKGYNQIERFLTANQGGGVQHIGLHTSDIFKTVAQLRENNVKIIQQPISYYLLEEKRKEFEDLELDPMLAHENSVIVDRDKDGYLLQVFTESLFDSDGFFLEIIQRRGSRGFGTGNVKALFSALQDKINTASAGA